MKYHMTTYEFFVFLGKYTLKLHKKFNKTQQRTHSDIAGIK